MIYLNNNTEPQEVWIERNDGLGSIHTTGSSGSYQEGFDDGVEYQKRLLSSTAFTINGNYVRYNGWSAVTVNVPQTAVTANLEEATIVISADTTNVVPSSGYDGFSAITIDATDYGNSQYEAGVDDGFTDGYASGCTDGASEEKAKLSATTFTANTAVTLSDGGYSAVTVNVPQTGYTQQDIDNAYSSGYTEGEEFGYDSGYDEGMSDQKALLSTTAITANGEYSNQNGWSGISVNVPTGISITLSSITLTANTSITVSDKAYTGITVDVAQTGYTQQDLDDAFANGEQSIIDTFTSTTVTINGVYGSTANPISSITVNVPQTGQSVTLEEKSVTITGDTTVVNPSQGYDGLSKVNIDATDYGNSKYNSGYTSGSTDGYASGYTDGEESGYQSGYVEGEQAGYDAGYETGAIEKETEIVESCVSTAFTENGTYSTTYDPNNESYLWSEVTVNVDTASTWNSGYTSGYTSGFTSGSTAEKAKLSAITINDSNTAITVNDGGYSAITVNVDTASTYNSGYTSGYSSGYSSGYTSGVTDGENNITSTFSSMTATTNGQYGTSAHPLSSITVNVPQTGSTAVLGNGSFSANGTYSASTANLDGYSAVTVNVQPNLERKWIKTNMDYFAVVPDGTFSSSTVAGTSSTAFTITKLNKPILFGEFIYVGGLTDYGYIGEDYPDSLNIFYDSYNNNFFVEEIRTGFKYTAVTTNNRIEIYTSISCVLNGMDDINDSYDGISSLRYEGNASFSKFIDGSVREIIIPEKSGVNNFTDIRPHCFDSLYNMSAVTIPKTITNIYAYAFNNCYSLGLIYSKATTAPTLVANTFSGIRSTGTVHYPSGSDYSSWQNDQYLSGWTFISDL